ncbi:MAG TPA: bifunctional UDP-N-acetylmuramoyl-tripeptide:D-alanyl-D-alanine ligase/alanine racemase [Parasegetibacter sp.]
MPCSAEHINRIVKGEMILNEYQAQVEHLLSDSRRVIFPATSIFFAIKGHRKNGHDFLNELYQKGVRCFVVEEDIETPLFPGSSVIRTPNVLSALHDLTAWHRSRFDIPVIGITGSNGKTVVKEWLNQLLEKNFAIARSPRSYNSQIGVPLSVWQLNEHHQLGIFEAGISLPDEMQNLAVIIHPTIGIFTNLGEAHDEGFRNPAHKADEKIKLFQSVRTLIYSKEHPEVEAAVTRRKMADGTWNPEFFTWGYSAECRLQLISINSSESNTCIEALYEGRKIEISIPFSDKASIENIVHCWCVMLLMNISDEEIADRMIQLGRIAMRLEMKKGINNCTIINDSYSADLSSLRIALDLLSHQHQHKKKTVILSDILQTGRNPEKLYGEVANALAAKKINQLYAVGPLLEKHRYLFEKIDGLTIQNFADTESFKAQFGDLSFNNEAVLLKGARQFSFEQISQLLEQKIHQTIMEVNLTALVHNLKEYQRLLKPSTALMAMVKAFSYGSGSFEVAGKLQYHNVDYLTVAYTDEGVELRKGGIRIPVMVMNPEPSSFEQLLQYDLEPDIFSFDMLDELENFYRRHGETSVPVHIELETGMNRLGFNLADVEKLALRLKQSGIFRVKSVFSHLAASEDAQHDSYSLTQYRLLVEACRKMEEILGYSFLRHISNTGAIVRHPDMQLDMVRIGIGLYGIDSAATGMLNLQPVNTLKTTIAQLKHLKEGDTVSYGRRGVITRNTTIATVRIGYADGFPRSLGNGIGKMWVNGRLAAVVGSVCMDMTMLDVTDIPDIKVGDDVIVFGKELPVEQVAAWAGTIPYEILTGISQRVKRVYFEE